MQLKDICCAQSSNIALKDLKYNSGPYPIYGASGFITCVDFFKIDKPYVGVVKDGAGVGRVMLLPEKSSVIGTMQSIIPTAGADAKYLSYLLDFLDLERYCSGATIPHIYFKDYGKETIPTHSPEQQQEISAALDKITKLIALRQGQLAKLDQLAKSRFIEMFGDPVTNPRKWQTASLLDFGSCKNGMNYHANENGIKINCLGVGDFQDKSVISDTSDLPVISLDSLPSSDYLLKDNDIVFVRSNGNKALVGRCVAVYPGNTPTVFSGFCIRFRQASSTVKTAYLLAVLRTSSVRKLMAGRGANIQNLNQQILASLRIPLPPLELQNEFAAFVEQLDKSKVTIRKSIEKLETTYRALLQEYFG